MYRKKRRFFQSILFRISIWILILGLAGMLLVTYFVRIQMQRHLEQQITEELVRVRDNSLLYVYQTLLLNDSRIDEESFGWYKYEIASQLEGAGYRELILCTADGRLLCGDGDAYIRQKDQEHFMQAKKQESAFTVHYDSGDQCQVYFSMPVILKDQSLGIISCHFDYGETYGRIWGMLERMILITVAVFAAICLVIWLMVFRILIPVRDLSRATSGVSSHLMDQDLDSVMLGELRFQRRRDEIGELFANYMEMLQVIEEQFQKIQEDKDRILTLWKSRQEFYNNVTHELKTPLTTISGYAQLMEKNGPGDRELFYNGTEHILKESTRLYRMVVQLLELQDKAGAEEIRQLELLEILKSVCQAMEIKAGRYDNRLVLTETGGPFPVMGREDKIRQVLINVIDNAIKYGEPAQEIRLGIFRQEGQVVVTVSNQGPGIRREELKTIFEPFYRANKGLSRELGSAGLGLSISAKIMEEHQGSITAESIPGGETTFIIRFPEAEPKEVSRWEN